MITDQSVLRVGRLRFAWSPPVAIHLPIGSGMADHHQVARWLRLHLPALARQAAHPGAGRTDLHRPCLGGPPARVSSKAERSTATEVSAEQATRECAALMTNGRKISRLQFQCRRSSRQESTPPAEAASAEALPAPPSRSSAVPTGRSTIRTPATKSSGSTGST